MRITASRSFRLAIAAIGVALAWVAFHTLAGTWFHSSAAFIPITFLAASGFSVLTGYASVHEFRRLPHLAAQSRLASVVFSAALALAFLASALFSLMWCGFYGPAYVSLLLEG
jgi:hypothetical protein